MDAQGCNSRGQLVWCSAMQFLAIFFSWIILLFLSDKRYQSFWYLRPIALLFSCFLTTTALNPFMLLFLFRYVRLVIHLVFFSFYQAVAVLDNQTLKAIDATVIVPTVQPFGKEFEECIQSILTNGPARIIVVTAGRGIYEKAVMTLRNYSNILIQKCDVQDKRKQVCAALPKVNTAVTVLCDDHVFWPRNFLPTILAPFDDKEVGCVGTQKRVRRTSSDFSTSGFWNLLGCLYLERHNFEIAATNTIDGGVFVVSGRTSAHRSAILKDKAFQYGFLNEYTFFGLVGPLNADDDNFITRWMVDHGWKIKIQYCKDACIETTLGEYPKFLSQCMRWARTTWRSNPRSLLSKQIWKTQPWCIYAVYLTSFVNFALLYDAAMVYTLWKQLTDPATNHVVSPSIGLLTLCLCIFCTKLIKPWPHFRRHPRDWRYLPGYILFGYFHSLVKLWALLTFWNIAWGSRPLNVSTEGEIAGEKDEEEGEEPGIDLSEGVIERDWDVKFGP